MKTNKLLHMRRGLHQLTFGTRDEVTVTKYRRHDVAASLLGRMAAQGTNQHEWRTECVKK
jgi:hypothetical protein